MLKRYDFYDKDGNHLGYEKAEGYFEALKKLGIDDELVDDFTSEKAIT